MTNQIQRFVDAYIKNDENTAVFITSRVNQRFFTSFPSSDGFVLITKNESYLLVDFRYAEAARKKSKNVTVIMIKNLMETLTELLNKHNIKTLALENETISYSLYKKYEAKILENTKVENFKDDLDSAIAKLRMIKDEYALSRIKEAQRLTDEAFSYILPRIKEGVTEKEIALDIEFFMRKNGAESVSFDLIVATGENGSQCHCVPGDNKVKKGDFITMDTGCIVDGYCSDMTRTVALGEISEGQKEIYDLVLKAHLAVFDHVKPGAKCCDIDKVARDIIEEKYKGCFGHSLGHSLGLEIHEKPSFSRLDQTILVPGMIITNEPGIYIEGKYGVRIEDMVYVTKTGCESLTKSVKELIIL